MRTLHLIRHGPTHAKTMVGWSDLPADLSNTERLTSLTAALPATALVVSSDLSRAVHTADAIVGARARLPHDAGLREMNFGDWELRTYDDIARETPELINQFWEHPGETSAPNGESWNQLAHRVNNSVDRLLRETDADLVIVCHFGPILTLVQRADKTTTAEVFGQRIENLSLTRIDIAKGDWMLRDVNILL